MKVNYESEFAITDAACKKASGHSLKEWFGKLEQKAEGKTRRDNIAWIYETMAPKDPWWSTTIWVEYERARNIVNKKDGRIEGYNICVTKTINAPLDSVYGAFTDSKLLAKWFGSGSKSCAEVGKTISDKDGNAGTFTRVRENKDLRFTWMGSESAAETLVDVAFADKGKGKTGITLNHNRIQTRAEADGLRVAWGAAFEKLKTLLE